MKSFIRLYDFSRKNGQKFSNILEPLKANIRKSQQRSLGPFTDKEKADISELQVTKTHLSVNNGVILYRREI